MSSPSTQKVGRYDVISEIGRGGMAVVYRAHDGVFNRDVAIKILPAELLHDAGFRARFEREARAIAGLEHPSIVPVYDFGETDGQPFFVMRLMGGGSLTNRIQECKAANKPFELKEAIRIFEIIGAGLDFAHSQGMIHRDLKPDNILFDAHNTPYIADFGIVKLSESGATLTGNAIVGTPAYMSPEQGRGEADIDGRSDLYSLGAILFECLTGRHVYEADSQMAMILKQISAPTPNILEFRPDLPKGVQLVLAKAMQKRKSSRYNTTAEFVEALKASTTENASEVNLSSETINIPYDTPGGQSSLQTPVPIPIPVPTPHPVPPPPVPAKQRGGFLRLFMGAFILLALLVGGLLGAQALAIIPPLTDSVPQLAFINTLLPGLIPAAPSASSTPTLSALNQEPNKTPTPPPAAETVANEPVSDPLESTPTPETAGATALPTSTAELTPDTLPYLIANTAARDSGAIISVLNFPQIEKLQVGSIGYLNDFDVSPDGTNIVVATTTGILFQQTDGTRDFFLPTQWSAESVVYAMDGTLIASANQHETLLIDAKTHKILFSLANPVMDRTKVVAFSANGQKLLSGGSHTFIWDVRTGKLVRQFENADAKVSGISGDGLLVGIPLQGNDINILSLEDGSIIKTLRVFNATKIRFSPDGTLLSVVNTGQIVRFFQVSDWKDLGNKDGNDIVYSKDGKTMAINVVKNHQIVIWRQNVDGLPNQKLQTYDYDRDGSVGMALSDDGYYFAFWYTGQVTLEPVAERYAVSVHRVVDNKRMSVLNTAVTWTSSAHFMPGGEELFTLSNHNTLQYWDITSGQEISKNTYGISKVTHSSMSNARPTAHGGSVVSANGVMKAVVNGNNIDLFFVQDGSLVRNIKATYDPAGDLAISPDGQVLANVSTGGLVRVWRVDDGRQICTIGGAINDLAALHFASDGTTIGVYRSSNVLSYYDATNCRQKASYVVGRGYFSQNRDLFIEFLSGEGASQDMIVRSLDKGEALLTIYGPFTEFNFSERGSLLEARLFDGSYHAWGIPNSP